MNIGNFLPAQTRSEGQSGRSEAAPDPAGKGFANVFAGLSGAEAAAAAVQASHMPVAAQMPGNGGIVAPIATDGAIAEPAQSDEAVLADVMKLVDAEAGANPQAAEAQTLPSSSKIPANGKASLGDLGDAAVSGSSPALASDVTGELASASANEAPESQARLADSQNKDRSSATAAGVAGLQTAQAQANDHATSALQAAHANIVARAEARGAFDAPAQTATDVEVVDLADTATDRAPPDLAAASEIPDLAISVDAQAEVTPQNPSDAQNVMAAAVSVPLALDPETKAKPSAPHPNSMNSEVRGSFSAQAGTPAAVLAQAEWARQQAMDSTVADGGGDFAALIDGPDAAAIVSAAASPVAVNAPGAVLRGLDSPLALANAPNMNTPVPANQLTQHAVAIIREIGDGRSQATIELHPAELGQLDLDMRQDGQRLEISVTVDNEQSRRLVQEQFAQWRDRLADSGVQLQRLDVEVRDQSSDARQNSDAQGGVANRGAVDDVKNPTRVVIRDPSRALDAYA